jgi:hypothetical protein
VGDRGEDPELGPAGRLSGVRHDRNGAVTQHRRLQDEAGDADRDRLRAPLGDDRVGRDDEEIRRAAMDGPRDRHVGRPTEALPGVHRELDLDDDHPDGDVAAEKNDDDISTVFGGLDLGQVDGRESSFGIDRKPYTQNLGQHLGGERGAVLEEIREDLVDHRGHGCVVPSFGSFSQPDSLDSATRYHHLSASGDPDGTTRCTAALAPAPRLWYAPRPEATHD